MPSRFGSLVKEACVLLDKFTSDNRCVDVFLEEASTSTDLQSIDPAERKFILEIVSGCVEYKKLLNVVISAFYGQNKKWLCRSDRSQFIIICYLAIFSLDELGLEHFSSIIKSLGTLKMHLFLDFFFSNLTSWIQEEWNSIYEAEFVESHWIGPLLRWRPEINLLMDQLAVTKESEVRRGPVKTTQCQEFNLSKPKPRPLPMPELIPLQEKSKSVPNTTYMAPREVQILEKIKQQNQQKAEELLIDAKMNHFRCGNPQKSELTKEPIHERNLSEKMLEEGHQKKRGKNISVKTLRTSWKTTSWIKVFLAEGKHKRVISQINAELDSKLKFDSFHSSGIPPSKKVDSCSVKLNNAAIRRREALHDRQVKEELQRIERLVQGAPDPSSYLQRQREMLEKDLQEKLQTTERKRLETQISEQEVALARTRITERNQKAAQLKKEETAQLMQIYAEKRLQEEKEFRDLVQQVTEGQNNTKAAKEKIRKLKQKIVKEVSERSQELLRQALEEQQEELCRKFKIIHEIHAIESLPRIRPSSFDDTETGGHELLSEMSLAELKERLALLRQYQQTQQEERRSHILEEKQKKKQEMLETLDNIELHRRVLAKEAAERTEEKKAKQELQQQLVAQDETILALKKKLEEKKQACQRVKQAERSRTKPCKKTPTGTPSQGDLKEKTWEELEQSIARNIQETL